MTVKRMQKLKGVVKLVLPANWYYLLKVSSKMSCGNPEVFQRSPGVFVSSSNTSRKFPANVPKRVESQAANLNEEGLIIHYRQFVNKKSCMVRDICGLCQSFL